MSLTIEELFQQMQSDDSGKEKTASYREVSSSVLESEVLQRIKDEMTDEDLAKQAAAATYSAEIMADVVIGRVSEFLKTAQVQIMENAMRYAMEKAAVGTSNAISGWLRESQYNKGDATEQMLAEDRLGRDNKSKSESYFNGSETRGASVSGGGHSEGGDGEPTRNTCGSTVHKLSAAKVAGKIKRAMLEEDLARYQELEQKKESGQISPEEEQELQELEQKLMALAQQQQGGGQPGAEQGGGAPPDAGGGAPGGGGAPPPQGGMAGGPLDAKLAAVKASVAKYFQD